MILVQCAVVGGKNVCSNWVVPKHLSCDRPNSILSRIVQNQRKFRPRSETHRGEMRRSSHLRAATAFCLWPEHLQRLPRYNNIRLRAPRA